jgi:predicted nucleic acid-binding protein
MRSILGSEILTGSAEGRAIDPRDLFVGCVAVQNGCAVVTNNREHFGRIPGLQVLSPSDVKRPPPSDE